MKNFAVYSEDKALLGAFEGKLKEKNFFQTSDYGGDYILIYFADKSFGVHIHSGNLKVFDLPQQWNEAVKALEELTQPQFKVGDWVIAWDDPKQVTKLEKRVSDSTFTTDYSIFVGKKGYIKQNTTLGNIKRHATKEEIKEELIRRSGLKIGDKVRYKKYPEQTHFLIEGFSLVESMHKYNSISCDQCYNERGVHLAVHGTDAMLPTDKVEKVKNDFDFEIDTTEGTFKPKIKDGQVKVGCVELSKEIYSKIFDIALFCNRNKTGIHIAEDGGIDDFSRDGDYMQDEVSLYKLEKIYNKLFNK